MIWRLLGVRIGRRVFDDGCYMPERTLVTIGDDCTLNAGSKIQCHSQEDGAFKSDRITIGAGCTLGVGALVHYGVTMGDGAVLAPDSFLMKGEEVPPHARWGGNPAEQADAADSRSAADARFVAESMVVGPGCRVRRPPHDHAVGRHRHRQRCLGGAGRHRGNGELEADSMGRLATAGREFWRNVLTAGGFTAIPRWTLDPAPGVGEHEATIPDDLVAALRRLADDLAVPLSSVLLAAHAKVLAALSGEREVATGYVAAEGGRTVAVPADDRARLVAELAAGRPSSRVGTVGAQGLPGR